MKKFYFGGIFLFLLFGCSLGNDQKSHNLQAIPITSLVQTGSIESVQDISLNINSGVTSEPSVDTVNEKVSGIPQENTGVIIVSKEDSTGSQEGNTDNTGAHLGAGLSSGQLFEKIIQKVSDIQTLEELDAYVPSLKNIEGRDNPRFIDFQKKQILLGLYISQISDPEYKKVISHMNDLISAKEIWPTEVQSLYIKMETLSGQLDLSQDDQNVLTEFQTAVINYAKAVNTFHSTPIFIEYAQKHADEIASIQSNQLQKFYSPEIIQLQNQIHSLYEKIYVTAPKN